MSIQNSLNSVVGALAGAALAGKHAKDKKEKEDLKQQEQVETVDENAEALKQANTMLKKAGVEEDLGKLQEEYKKDKEELGQWKQGLVDVGNGTYMKTNDDLSEDIKMRNKALKVMRQKMKAKRMQIDAYKNMLGGKK
ncbi:MAG: hypothetical protein J6S67_23825 [Methanobrevibacter sp.]|nr:hypothetical protein [Methanobrevibacter sp.]